MAKHLKISKNYSIIIHYTEFENTEYTFRPGVYMYNVFKDKDTVVGERVVTSGDLIYSGTYESHENIKMTEVNNIIINDAKVKLRNHLIKEITK